MRLTELLKNSAFWTYYRLTGSWGETKTASKREGNALPMLRAVEKRPLFAHH